MAERRADEGTVERHLGDAGVEVVAMLAAVMRDPRGEQFLDAEESTRGDHLGSQRVRLELLEVCLDRC